VEHLEVVPTSDAGPGHAGGPSVLQGVAVGRDRRRRRRPRRGRSRPDSYSPGARARACAPRYRGVPGEGRAPLPRCRYRGAPATPARTAPPQRCRCRNPAGESGCPAPTVRRGVYRGGPPWVPSGARGPSRAGTSRSQTSQPYVNASDSTDLGGSAPVAPELHPSPCVTPSSGT
jgi:hypothetical protein